MNRKSDGIAVHLPHNKLTEEGGNPQGTTFSDKARRMVDKVKAKLLPSGFPEVHSEPKNTNPEKLTVKQAAEQLGAKVQHQLIEGYNQTIGSADA